jgi:hypothetical protein
MCRAGWIKTTLLKAAKLDELDADGFDVYIQWLYGRSIPTYVVDTQDDRARCIRLIKAHIVGEFLQDVDFQQAVRSEIIEDSLENNGMDSAPIVFAYKETSGSCALREFLVDLYALRGDMEWFKDTALPRSVLIDLAQSLLAKIKPPKDYDVWSCMAAAGHIEQETEASGADEGED